jgi:hypothetical protein
MNRPLSGKEFMSQAHRVPGSTISPFLLKAIFFHGIGNRSRKGISLIPCPWITQGESEGLYG